MPHQDDPGLADPGKSAVEEDELGARIGLDQVDQVHRVRALDPAVAGVDLKRQLVLGLKARPAAT